jgi:Arc/MetJ-type ribon-helix-helix transcriptional regulator
MSALRDVMGTLNLTSTSDAIREGLRLLAREAAEVAAAEEIRGFYNGEQAPVPDAVAAPADDELAAADNAQW